MFCYALEGYSFYSPSPQQILEWALRTPARDKIAEKVALERGVLVQEVTDGLVEDYVKARMRRLEVL